jgi:hypothetical protein
MTNPEDWSRLRAVAPSFLFFPVLSVYFWFTLVLLLLNDLVHFMFDIDPSVS